MKTIQGVLYDVETGHDVRIEPTHLIVTGLTNKSGKTTTLEALAKASGLKVLVFLTKRGEKVFTESHAVDLYFSANIDWRYVEQLLEATMKERMKFERSWIITASKGAKSLEQVAENVRRLKEESNENSLRWSVYNTLEAYFDIVLPQLERLRERLVSTFPKLSQGINAMDLTGINEEVQALIIRAVLEYVQDHLTQVVVIIPELWKFSPEGRGGPVKLPLERLVRQGATNEDFVWFDSQDLAGVDKSPLKQVFTWILGLQTEKNEAQHTLEQIPIPRKSKPDPSEIQTLKKGHFILASPDQVKRVYVRPAWMPEEIAVRIAKGDLVADSDEVQEHKALERVASVFKPEQLAAAAATISAQREEDFSEFDERLRKLEALVK